MQSKRKTRFSAPTRQKTTSTAYESIGEIICKLADVFRPPERLTVSAASELYVKLNNPGAYVGDWHNYTTPYMVEPQDELAARDKDGLIFVGPAQSAKTQALILNWTAYSVKVDPMDMMIFCPSGAAARDFSTRRIDRLHRHSPEIGAMLLHGRDADNKFDKHYTTGMMLTLSWPSVVEFAGRPIGRIALTDYDRMPDDVDGEGSPYDLASKRTTTFGSFAMTLAESSPSRPITDPKWIAQSPHQAPPCEGILGLYNRGDMRRWYWPCPHCGSYFEGRFEMLTWDTGLENTMDRAETAKMTCPHCSESIHPDDRHGMQLKGHWLADGQYFDGDQIMGEPARSRIASFWLRGVAAAFISWPKLVGLFIDADDEYNRTGSEEALKKFYNNDLGEPYMPKSMESERLPEVIKARAEDWGSEPDEPTVPDDVRFLLGCIDVQKNAWVVQVHGVLPGAPCDIVVIDRFSIIKSQRFDESGDRLWVKPGSYLEDWDLLLDHVLKKSYPLADGSGRRMMIKAVACDSGGREGVTTNAYSFYRKLRTLGLAGRFQLVKGEGKPGQPRIRMAYPDSSRRDLKAAAQGDVPVLMLASNLLKDELSNRLDSLVPGKGMIRFPAWLPDWFYSEMCAETRSDKGWINPSHTRNEAWDLAYYCLGLLLSPMVRVEQIDWTRPPGWAAPWENNSLIMAADAVENRFEAKPLDLDFGKLGQALA